jgi:dual-specificity kinase
VKELFRNILVTVDFIHKNGIIHTDLKPHNILLESDDFEMLVLNYQDRVWLPKSNAIRIIDFGGAAKAGEDDNSYRIGTLIYRSPEALL